MFDRLAVSSDTVLYEKVRLKMFNRLARAQLSKEHEGELGQVNTALCALIGYSNSG